MRKQRTWKFARQAAWARAAPIKDFPIPVGPVINTFRCRPIQPRSRTVLNIAGSILRGRRVSKSSRVAGCGNVATRKRFAMR